MYTGENESSNKVMKAIKGTEWKFWNQNVYKQK